MLLSVFLIGGIRPEFILFAMTLAGVAIFHKRTMEVALVGLLGILLLKFFMDPGFGFLQHFFGDLPLVDQLLNKDARSGEWPILLNLLGLLLGFAILARVFEESKVPEALPAILPDDWKGGLLLLFLIMLLSSFLDNIAAAMIGGSIAMVVYKGKVHLGYLAAIIAASNAGGAGSVVGDTTTTLMWIDGVDPLDVTHAYIASIAAFLIFGVVGSLQQDRYHKIRKDPPKKLSLKYDRLLVVLAMLIMAIVTNFFYDFPALGVWIAILLGALFVPMPWRELSRALKGSIFLIALVTAASLMPVEELPAASVGTALALGFVSSVFDNIPLTKLCLDQGGYDWGVLAYAVGFGGSMIWFGSSAGVALSGMYPETRNTFKYVAKGWHVILAYVIGFYVMIAIAGWNPHTPHRIKPGQETIIKTGDQ